MGCGLSAVRPVYANDEPITPVEMARDMHTKLATDKWRVKRADLLWIPRILQRYGNNERLEWKDITTCINTYSARGRHDNVVDALATHIHFLRDAPLFQFDETWIYYMELYIADLWRKPHLAFDTTTYLASD